MIGRKEKYVHTCFDLESVETWRTSGSGTLAQIHDCCVPPNSKLWYRPLGHRYRRVCCVTSFLGTRASFFSLPGLVRYSQKAQGLCPITYETQEGPPVSGKQEGRGLVQKGPRTCTYACRALTIHIDPNLCWINTESPSGD